MLLNSHSLKLYQVYKTFDLEGERNTERIFAAQHQDYAQNLKNALDKKIITCCGTLTSSQAFKLQWCWAFIGRCNLLGFTRKG